MKLFLIFSIAFFITFRTVPTLVKLANKFDIYDTFSKRKIHTKKISFLGGIGIVFGFLISILLTICLFGFNLTSLQLSLITGLIIIFFHGLGDDLFEYNSKKKLLFQLILSFFLVYYGGIKITHFERFLPISQMPAYLENIISILIFMTIINAYNMIDGADGITTIMAIVPCLYYTYAFSSDGQMIWAAMTSAISGSLIAYFLFNKPPAYIFMGDNGSLFIGLFLGAVTIYFVNAGNTVSKIHSAGRVIIAFSIIALPILDLIRLFFYRLIQKKSPFNADNEHIHHLLIKFAGQNWNNKVLYLVLQLQLFLASLSQLFKNVNWFIYIITTIIGYFVFVKFLRIIIKFDQKIESSKSNKEMEISSDGVYLSKLQ